MLRLTTSYNQPRRTGRLSPSEWYGGRCVLVGAAATRRGELPLGAARLDTGERDDGAGERERVRDERLPALPPSAAIARSLDPGEKRRQAGTEAS